jgi:hypothetical protein
VDGRGGREENMMQESRNNENFYGFDLAFQESGSTRSMLVERRKIMRIPQLAAEIVIVKRFSASR